MKKTVLRVSFNCQKCKKVVLKAITKLEGISSVVVVSDKGTLTVLGDADPVLMVKQIRKTGKLAEIISVGPINPKSPKPPLESNRHLSTCCKDCQLVVIYHQPYEGGLCSIR